MTDKPKKEPWRIAVAAVAVLYIVFLWAKKDLGAVYANLPPEALLPMIVTSLGVTLLKVAAITAAILLIRWIGRKLGHKERHSG